jgi:hypothetical protein
MGGIYVTPKSYLPVKKQEEDAETLHAVYSDRVVNAIFLTTTS